MNVATSAELRRAAAHLSAADAILAPVIERAGLPTFRPHKNYYWSLVNSIISQQLSVKAADTIEKRFLALFDSDVPEPAEILEKSYDDLRAASLSGAKVGYIRDLAQHVLDGKLQFDKFDKLSNDEVIAELTDVKGVGEWTAHMFLIFCMGRLDILPVGDLGIRNGVRKLYGLAELPTPAEVTELAAARGWHPYESAASWYVWHSLDNKPMI